jgi:AcrR family transcriptional regulator
MARRSEHSLEQIREMILSSAQQIVSEQGLETLTVRKIAQDIGYTVGSIYMVFTNMQELVLHIKAQTLDKLAEHLAKNVLPDASPEQGIYLMAENYLQFAKDNFNCWRLVFESDAGYKSHLPVWYLSKIEQMFIPVEVLLQALSPGLSTEQYTLAARTLWGGVHGVCVLSLHGNLGRAGVENSTHTVRLLTESFLLGWKQSCVDLQQSMG